MGALKNSIKVLYDAQGAALKHNSATAVFDEMNSPKRNMQVAADVRMGMFAFMLYDLAGKSSAMEQYSPVLLVDWLQVKTQRYVWGLSLNFIPSNVRVVFFDQLLERQANLVASNAARSSVSKERPLQGITFDVMYKVLQSIGYEYALRKFDYSLITKMYEVSFGFLDRFLTFDTTRFTGVDEGKLMQIWLTKLKDQEERHQRMMTALYNDYDKMAEVLQKQLLTATETAKAIAKTAANMRKMG